MSHLYSHKNCQVCNEMGDCLAWEDGFLCVDCYDAEVLNVNRPAPDVYKVWQESVLRIRDQIIKRDKALEVKGEHDA